MSSCLAFKAQKSTINDLYRASNKMNYLPIMRGDGVLASRVIQVQEVEYLMAQVLVLQ